MPTTYERERSIRIQDATTAIIGLFTKYGITPSSAKREVQERFTQADYDAYKTALAALDGDGGIG